MALSSSSPPPPQYPFRYGSPRFLNKDLPVIYLEPVSPFSAEEDWRFDGKCCSCNCTISLDADQISRASMDEQYRTECCGEITRLHV